MFNFYIQIIISRLIFIVRALKSNSLRLRLFVKLSGQSQRRSRFDATLLYESRPSIYRVTNWIDRQVCPQVKAKDPSTLFDWTITMAITSPGKRVFRLIISLCYPFLPRNIVICIHSKKKKKIPPPLNETFVGEQHLVFFSRARRVRE